MNHYLITIRYYWGTEQLQPDRIAYFYANSSLEKHWNWKLSEFLETPPDKPLWYRVGIAGGEYLETKIMYVTHASVTKINLKEKK